MQHLKTFEQYNGNDETNEGIRKFFTGFDSKEDRDEAMLSFHKALDEAEARVAERPEAYSFNKEKLEAQAKENNYKGGLREIQDKKKTKRIMGKEQRNPNYGKIYFQYEEGLTGLQTIGQAAGGHRREMIGM